MAARPVAAHAELVSADPPVNGSVAEAPRLVRLTFSEAVDPDLASVRLLDVHQQPVEGVGQPVVSPNGLMVAVGVGALQPGVYTVEYEVVSLDDGHDTSGSYAFLFDPTSAAPPPADSSSSVSRGVDGLTITARWIGLLGLLIGLGGVLMWWNAGRTVEATRGAAPPWRMIGLASMVGAAGIVGYLALAARPLPDVGITLDPAAPFGWTPFAIAMRVSILACLASAAACWIGARRQRPVAAAVVVGCLLALAMGGMSAAGHASADGGAAFGALDWFHLVAVAAWLGGLPAAAILARRAGDDWRRAGLEILRRHGRLAMVAAPVVAMTGVANSTVVLGANRDLVASDYGNLLLTKALLLAIALGIGAVNHLALRGMGRIRIGMLVAGEMLVAVLAIGVAATMVTIQPSATRGAVVHAPPVMPAHFFETMDSGRVHVAANLPAPGRQTYRVMVTDPASGGPSADVVGVSLTFEPPTGSDLETHRVTMDLDARNAVWVATGDFTPVAGAWQLELAIERASRPEDVKRFPLDVVALDAPETGPPPTTGILVPAPLAIVWMVLPNGVLAWLPSLLALVALGVMHVAWRPRADRPVAPATIVRAGLVAMLLVTGLGAASRALVDAANAPSPAALDAQPTLGVTDPDAGRALFVSNCSACHGTDARGGGPVRTLPAAPSLERFTREASDALLSYRIAYGVAGTAMPAFAGSMTLDERSDLIGYLRHQFEDR